MWIETQRYNFNHNFKLVTPCVGVWIETDAFRTFHLPGYVTPCVGVWIETQLSEKTDEKQKSHPAWVCGLKPIRMDMIWNVSLVTPCVGVWIETVFMSRLRTRNTSHTLRGCVD